MGGMALREGAIDKTVQNMGQEGRGGVREGSETGRIYKTV
jgi:hypothetical protein